ncbi:DUF202 domain-containing protein [Streptomyces sp. J2-1]|uniref:DUF202 domain-containing protein n=1 Tax=Streptomyces corallincola TaxID=2851888 RepID=UPI001C3846E1|nr:DUF202 domain-containing protein [Streptomyces corallincola]MBV2356181.1 DUF202 domain-containing protein [Streptomyces corallincola]
MGPPGGADPVGTAGSPAAPVRDPGLQPERTRLAWRRTTLSATVAAVLAVRAALRDGATPAGVVACGVCGLLWLAFLVLAHRRIRALAAGPRPDTLTPRRATAAVLCALAMAVCAAALVS